jgi:hypothetical protein
MQLNTEAADCKIQPRGGCRWVPVLFGIAGILIGVGVPLLDEALHVGSNTVDTDSAGAWWQRPPPSWTVTWPGVMVCISCFVMQYALSGGLPHLLPASAPPVVDDAILLILALAVFATFDGTAPGAILALATCVGGPLIEVGLINAPGLDLYHYTAPDVWGIPTWIAWVYACGGPAVGNLGRMVWAELKQQQQQRQLRS